jgi:hypothetical protein
MVNKELTWIKWESVVAYLRYYPDLNSDLTNATVKISTANSVIFGVSPTAWISPKAIKNRSMVCRLMYKIFGLGLSHSQNMDLFNHRNLKIGGFSYSNAIYKIKISNIETGLILIHFLR